jgi:hypothetical protein
MSTYSTQDFERIAEAIGKSPALVMKNANRLEAAAAWYRLYCRAPKDVLLADTAKRMRHISNAARRLLNQLEVYDYRNAPDGPGDLTLLAFLAPETISEDEIIGATAQIGRLAEIFDTTDAAQLLESCSRKAVEESKHLSRLTSMKGRRGDYAVNVWLAEMMSIYERLTGKPARNSITPIGPNRGKPCGPFFRFLQATSKPVEFEGKALSLNGVRERIRALSRTRRSK